MLFVRELQTDERQALDQAANNPSLDWSQRARIILLSAASKTVPDISAEVRLHPINVRKWIHRFNMRGLAGLRSGKSPGRPPVFSETQRQEIADLAHANPREVGSAFDRWSLQSHDAQHRRVNQRRDRSSNSSRLNHPLTSIHDHP